MSVYDQQILKCFPSSIIDVLFIQNNTFINIINKK